MKLIMIEDTKGSPTGIYIKEYEKDVEYDIPEKLAKVFLKMKVATKVKDADDEEKKIQMPSLGNLLPPKNKVNKTPNTKGRKKKGTQR